MAENDVCTFIFILCIDSDENENIIEKIPKDNKESFQFSWENIQKALFNMPLQSNEGNMNI